MSSDCLRGCARRSPRKTASTLKRCWKTIVKDLPAPAGDEPMRRCSALIFDSQYDSYKGVIVYFRVMDGVIGQGMDVKMMVRRCCL